MPYKTTGGAMRNIGVFFVIVSLAACGDAGPTVVDLEVRANTTGTDIDVVYLVALDDGPWHLLNADGTVLTFPEVTPGAHELRVAGIAPNCTLDGAATRTVNIPATDPEPAFPYEMSVTCTATTRQILFTSRRDGGYDLYLMDHDGSNPTRLTDGSVEALHGAWSPDGTRIAYHSPAGLGWDVFVMNADGSGSTPLTTDGSSGAANIFPRWHPDGTTILFEKSEAIWRMDPDGGNAASLGVAGERPDWSPDGNRIAYYSDGEIWLVDADGTGATPIQQMSVYPLGSPPTWSPDGSKILFGSPRIGSPLDIYVMNADGSGVTRLTDGPTGYGNYEFSWSPAGQRIAFTTNRDNNPEVYLMNANGSSPTNLTQHAAHDFGPAWHP